MKSISILASRVGRDGTSTLSHMSRVRISILASRVGRDLYSCCADSRVTKNFNPRVPGGTRLPGNPESAPRARHFNPRVPGGTRRVAEIRNIRARTDFNPRVPGGTRPAACRCRPSAGGFQSSRPGWDATPPLWSLWTCRPISILASRVGRDSAVASSWSVSRNFNPRVPGGTRPSGQQHLQRHVNFNPRVPGGTRRSTEYRCCRAFTDFNPRVPGGTRRHTVDTKGQGGVISILASRVGRDRYWSYPSLSSLLFQSSRPGWDATAAS